MRPTEPGKHYGLITAKAMQVLRALLWDFHNAITGKCFPSYEAIAEKAHCDRSTVHKAIIALEAAGLLTWLHRIKRVYEAVTDLLGGQARGVRSRVLRTSNGYIFSNPPDVESSKSKISTGTTAQALFLPLVAPVPAQLEPENPLHAALTRLERAISERR